MSLTYHNLPLNNVILPFLSFNTLCFCCQMFYFYTYSIHPQYTLNILFYIVSSLFKVYFIFWPHHTACGILVPQTGIEPRPWQWKQKALTMGPPGNSLKFILYLYIYIYICIICNFQCSFLCVQSLFHLVLFSSTWRIFFTIFYSPGLLVTDSLTFDRKGLSFSFSKLHILYKEF